MAVGTGCDSARINPFTEGLAMRGYLLPCALIAGALTIAGCAGPKAHAAGKPARTPQAVSTSAAPTCTQRLITWRDGGSVADLQALASALGKDGTAMGAMASDPTSSTAQQRASTDAAALLAAAQTVQGDPAPACAAKVRANMAASATDLIQAAHSELNGIQAFQSGDVQTAANEIQVTDSSIGAGSKALRKAITAIQQYAG